MRSPSHIKWPLLLQKEGRIRDAYKQSQEADPVLNFATGETAQAIIPSLIMKMKKIIK